MRAVLRTLHSRSSSASRRHTPRRARARKFLLDDDPARVSRGLQLDEIFSSFTLDRSRWLHDGVLLGRMALVSHACDSPSFTRSNDGPTPRRRSRTYHHGDAVWLTVASCASSKRRWIENVDPMVEVVEARNDDTLPCDVRRGRFESADAPRSVRPRPASRSIPTDYHAWQIACIVRRLTSAMCSAPGA